MRRPLLLAVSVVLGLVAAGAWMAGLAHPARAAEANSAPTAPSLPISESPDPSRLHPQVLKSLAAGAPAGPLTVVVELRQPAALVEALTAGLSGEAARAALAAGLKAAAAVRAEPVLEVIEAEGGGVDVRVFWVAPVVRLTAEPGLIAALSHLPEVVQIRPDERFRIAIDPAAAVEPDGYMDPNTGLPWNLALIGLELVQPGLGLDGTGVVVANLDTGVDWTHPVLMEKYRGFNPLGPPLHAGSWHVSTDEFYPAPGDGIGHGTHTMGTMVGEAAGGIRTGVAPGAQWIAVKLIDDQGYFYESWIHDAFEWLLAPEGDSALAPDIVNGSWGTGFTADPRFRPDVQVLRASGILPVFSAGNAGPFESTAGSPGDYPESLAVGAVDDIALVTSFSGRGPSLPPWSEIKPELVAPGADVLSSVPGGGYALWDGTSMAAPHVAGVAALLLQANPGLDSDDLEQILIATASPLGAPGPDNDTGWGLVDAYTAALTIVPHGRIIGLASAEDGHPIPFPVVTAAPLSGAQATVLSGDAAGRFDLPLAPGAYTLTVEGFAFEPGKTGPITVQNGSVVEVEIHLARLPHGTVTGTILDKSSGGGVPAELVIAGTGFSEFAGPDGSFEFELPAGTWEIDIRSATHRLAALTAFVIPGQAEEHVIYLEPAPAILLVDAGRWYYHSKIEAFRFGLDELRYSYTLHDIRDPYGVLSGQPDIPTEAQLTLYDLVIWSAPFDSPGLVQAGEVISGFLSTGGMFLLSGEDTAYWDGGGSLFVYPEYFPHFVGAWFDSERPETLARGIDGTPLAGLDLVIGGPGAEGQFLPDTVSVSDPLLAETAMIWEDGGTAALFSGGCRPYRMIWTGFGLEGVGPLPQRVEALDRMLAWFDLPPPEIGIHLPELAEPSISEAGETITRTMRVENTGTLTETFQFSLSGNIWPSILVFPDGTSTAGTKPFTIPGCSSVDLETQVSIPGSMARDVFDLLTIRATPISNPDLVTSTMLTSKTPAQLLLIDDGLFIWYGDAYAEALKRIGIPFDFVSTKGEAMAEDILPRYPLVIWTTGWDWFLSLPPNEQAFMKNYLDLGGRLLLSSQDFLNRVGDPALVGEFGVLGARYEVTPTVALAVPGDFLGLTTGAWDLDYPLVNWSDGLHLQPGAMPLLYDQGGNVLGAANLPGGSPAARTIFFSFPLETLPDEALDRALRAATLWLGPFGGSVLNLPEVVPADGSFALQFQLMTPETTVQTAATIALAVPEGAHVAPGTVSGPWWYDPSEQTLVWHGDLAPETVLDLAAGIELEAAVPGSLLTFSGTLQTGDGQVFRLERQVVVDGPYVTVDKTYSPAIVTYDQNRIAAVVTVSNDGFSPADPVVTITLPTGFSLVPGSLFASSGVLEVDEGVIRWTGTIDPGSPVTITYSLDAFFPQLPGLYAGYAEVWDGLAARGDWAVVELAGSLYFPLIDR